MKKSDQRKRQIMEVALRLFAENGYHYTSVADIIRETRIARGTFYIYFKNKSDLFNQLLELNFRYIKQVLPLIPTDRLLSSEEFEEILRTVFLKFLSQPDSRYFISMMVNQAAGADTFFATKINNFYDEVAQMFSDYLLRFQENGLIDKQNPKITAYLIIGASREAFIQWAIGGDLPDLETVVHEVASFIIHGIKIQNGNDKQK